MNLGYLRRCFKALFRLYEPEHEYWVMREDIIVPLEYRRTRIGRDKFRRKMNYYKRTGELESKIILDKDFHLLDGYSSVRIAEICGIDRLTVYFE